MTEPASYEFRRNRAGSVMLTQYRDVCAALQDPRFAHWWIANGTSTGYQRAMERWFERMDPAERSPVRANLVQRLSARGFERHRAAVARTIETALAGVRDGVPFDLVGGYAAPLVADCVAGVLGVQPAQRPRFDAIIGPLCAGLFSGASSHAAVLAEWGQIVEEIIEADGDGDHFVGDLVRSRQNGDDFGDADLVAFTAMFADAAYENITNFIVNSIAVLAEHPRVWDALAGDPADIATTVEELLRYASPMNYVPLVAREDIASAAGVIERGSTVLACLPLANHDREQFPDAGRLDPRRRPNRHLSFGTGPLACVGAAFARIQAAIAIRELARRFAAPVVLRSEIEPKPSALFNGSKRLPVTLTRRRAAEREEVLPG
jgi:cytochrome P450